MSARRRGKGVSILAVLAAGAVLLIASTQTWLGVRLSDSPDALLAVAGATALPVLAPLSLAALAAGAALSLAGRVAGTLFGILTAALGLALAALTLPIVFAPPLAAVAPTVTDATGIAGDRAIEALVSAVSATPWPAIALAAAVVLAGAGGFVSATARHWRAGGRRYRTQAGERTGGPAGPLDAIDSWDDLTRGSDPTEERRDARGGDAAGDDAR